MKKEIIETIEQIYKYGDFGYTLFNYVDTNFWYNEINREFQGLNIENLTDFNYSKSFQLFVYGNEPKSYRLGTKEFNSFVEENKGLNGLLIYISAISPYVVVEHVRYEYHKELKMISGEDAYDELTKSIKEKLLNYLRTKSIYFLPKELIESTTVNVNNEDLTVFEALFEGE